MMLATCTECDFQRSFNLGGGMLDFTTNCPVPGINVKTGKFVVKNYFKKDELKGKVIFYNEPCMSLDTNKEEAIGQNEPEFKEHKNKCPQCHQYTRSSKSSEG